MGLEKYRWFASETKIEYLLGNNLLNNSKMTLYNERVTFMVALLLYPFNK